MTDFKLLENSDYIVDATRAITKAKKRVLVLAMVIADHPATHDFIEALLDAAKRGVKVSVAADVFTYGEVNGSFLPLLYFNSGPRKANQMVKTMRRAGVRFQWLGRTRTTIFNGRTHTKWTIIDDTVYSFGGVNIYQDGVSSHSDYMLKITDSNLAERMALEHKRILDIDRGGRLYRSHQFDIDGDHVLIDGGINGNSIIYRRACDLAASAKSIIFVSQYPPTGKLSKIFRKHHAKLYFNRPELASYLNRIVIKYGMKRSNLKSSYTRNRYIHAKFMIFTMPDGSKVALTGSHNFNYSGVALGTREIALESRNPAVIEQLEGFFNRSIE